MTIITKGMGAIIKHLGKKRKTLTISGSKKSYGPKPRGTPVIKKAKTKLADTWQDRRIQAINKKIKKSGGKPHVAEGYAQEASDIYKSKAPTKKSYKDAQKKFYALPEDQRNKIWKIRSRRELKGKK